MTTELTDKDWRIERVWAIQDTIERLWYGEPNYITPITYLWMATNVALVNFIEPADARRMMQNPSRLKLLQRSCLRLESRDASRMFFPNFGHAEWSVDDMKHPAYITHWAITKMLEHYGETGEVRWVNHRKKPQALHRALADVCESNDILVIGDMGQCVLREPLAEKNLVVETVHGDDVEEYVKRPLSDILGWYVEVMSREEAEYYGNVVDSTIIYKREGR